jgi:hypothetical protein
MMISIIIYTLGLTLILKTNSDISTTKIFSTTIRKRNFSGTIPNRVSLESRKIGGLESIDIYAQQGTGNLIQFSRASRDKNEKGKLLKIKFIRWRYSLGIEQYPFQVQEEITIISHSESIRFKELSNFIQRYKIEVETNIKWNQKQRERMNTKWMLQEDKDTSKST